jgi:cyanophycinase
MDGTLALLGGLEWTAGSDADVELLRTSGARTVTVIPTAMAYEQPAAVVERAREWFGSLGAEVEVLPAFRRTDASDESLVRMARGARFLYLTSGTPMHLRSVLFDSPLLDAVVEAWHGGAVLCAAGESAAALSTHMVDPRGGAFTVGLGLLTAMTVVPHASAMSEDKWHRTLRLAPAGLDVVGIDDHAALIGDATGWRTQGSGRVTVTRSGKAMGLEDLPVLGAG